MPPTNSLGAGPPKQRTINVEVNILAEWLEKRARLREERLRWTGVLTSLTVIGLVAVPFLSGFAASAESRSQKAVKVADGKAAVLAELQKQQDLVQPKIDSEATLQLSRKRANAFLGELIAVLNSSSPKMAIELVESAILGGEVTIRAKAQSESYLAAQEYVVAAEQGARVKSAILTTARPHEALGSEGVTFEFAKRVEVGK